MSEELLFEDEDKGDKNVYLPEDKKQLLHYAVENDVPALLVGETGVGKNTIVRELAKEKGKDLKRISLTSRLVVEDIVGKHLMKDGNTYWQDGPLTRAMKNGDWIMFDEINMAPADILSKIHSLLEDNERSIDLSKKGDEEDETLVAKDGFRFFATMNPADDYAGTKHLNKAFKSRMLHIRINYSNKETEIIQEQTGVDQQEAETLVTIAEDIRATKENRYASYTCSTRDLIQCANLLAEGIDRKTAYKTALVDKAPTEDRGPIMDTIEMLTGDKIELDNGQTYNSISDLVEEAQEVEEMKEEYEEQIEYLKEERDDLKEERDDLKEEKEEYEQKFNEAQSKFQNEQQSHQESKKVMNELADSIETIVKKAEAGAQLEDIDFSEFNLDNLPENDN